MKYFILLLTICSCAPLAPAIPLEDEKKLLFALGSSVPERFCGPWSRNVARLLLHPSGPKALLVWIEAHPQDKVVAQFTWDFIRVFELYDAVNPAGVSNSLCLKAPRGSLT